MDEHVERTRDLAARAAGLYGEVLDRLEAVLERMPVSEVTPGQVASLVGILKGAELSWRGLERVKTGGDAAKTLLDLVREMDVEDSAESPPSPILGAAPVPDEADEADGQEEEGDRGPDPVAGRGGPAGDGQEGAAE